LFAVFESHCGAAEFARKSAKIARIAAGPYLLGNPLNHPDNGKSHQPPRWRSWLVKGGFPGDCGGDPRDDAATRDALIVTLRRRGLTHKQIESQGVAAGLRRIAERVGRAGWRRPDQNTRVFPEFRDPG
jgi:hypothetical protein